MAFELASAAIGGGNFADITNFDTNIFAATQVDSSALFAIGTEVECLDTTNSTRARFCYHRGVASVVDTDACILKHGDNAAILLFDNSALTSELGMVGFAMGAVTAALYGWFQVWGRAEVNAAASFGEGADDGLFATSTAGTVDDAAAGNGGQIFFARVESAIGTPAAGTAYVDIWYPFIPGTAGDDV